MVLLAISKFGKNDHNLHNHVFNDVICKPSIEEPREDEKNNTFLDSEVFRRETGRQNLA